MTRCKRVCLNGKRCSRKVNSQYCWQHSGGFFQQGGNPKIEEEFKIKEQILEWIAKSLKKEKNKISLNPKKGHESLYQKNVEQSNFAKLIIEKGSFIELINFYYKEVDEWFSYHDNPARGKDRISRDKLYQMFNKFLEIYYQKDDFFNMLFLPHSDIVYNIKQNIIRDPVIRPDGLRIYNLTKYIISLNKEPRIPFQGITWFRLAGKPIEYGVKFEYSPSRRALRPEYVFVPQHFYNRILELKEVRGDLLTNKDIEKVKQLTEKQNYLKIDNLNLQNISEIMRKLADIILYDGFGTGIIDWMTKLFTLRTANIEELEKINKKELEKLKINRINNH